MSVNSHLTCLQINLERMDSSAHIHGKVKLPANDHVGRELSLRTNCSTPLTNVFHVVPYVIVVLC